MQVLDKGFVELIDSMGDDLKVVNAARISFNKKKEAFDEKDEALIRYLVEHKHNSPFRHCFLTFHIKAPIFVFRQWMKHRIASEFNEISGRYVEFDKNDYYTPQVFRRQSKNNKQGSEGIISDPNINGNYKAACLAAIETYRLLVSSGLCKEQARMVLPLAMYSEVYWTASLEAVAHFIKLRSDSHAQWEIQQYANVVNLLTEHNFPISMKYLKG